MAADWYPDPLDERDSWHVAYDAQAQATGTAHNLSAQDKLDATVDSIIVGLLADYDEALRGYVEAFTQWRDDVLDGPEDGPFPDPPTPPTLTLPDENFKPGVQPRTRRQAGKIKASDLYTQAVGEDYGIVGTGTVLSTPSINSANPVPGTSHIALVIGKGGYELVAVDVRVNGGAWTELIRTQTANFTDTTAPLAPGAPETREFRCQGVVNNARVGDLSATVSAVTTP